MKKNLSMKIISLLFAIVLWFYIIQVQAPEIERNIKDVPVLFTQQAELKSRNLMLINDKEYSVDLKIRGQRKFLQDLDNTDVAVSADVGNIYSTGSHTIHTSVAVPYGNVEVLNQNPSLVTVTVDEIVEIEKEIVVVTNGDPKAGYVVGKTKTNPETILIKGAKTIVGGVDHARVVIDVTGKNEDISTVQLVELVSSSGTVIDSTFADLSKDKVEVHCEILKEKNVSIEVIFEEGVNTETEWYELEDNSVKSITIAGMGSALEKLDKVQTEKITKAMLDGKESIEVALVIPEGILSLDGEKVTLRFKKNTKTQ